jgi:hypothetical protein
MNEYSKVVFLDKKGVFVGIIITLVAFVVVAGVLTQIFGVFSSDDQDHLLECWAILGTKKIEQDFTQSFVDVYEQECYTSVFDVDATTLNTNARVSQYFADLMGRVWYTVHEGTIDELWNDEGITGFTFFDNHECQIVAIANVDGQLTSELSTQEFKNYLFEETYLENEAGIDWSYRDYFQFYAQRVVGSTRPAVIGFDIENDVIVGDTSYGVAISSFESSYVEDFYNSIDVTGLNIMSNINDLGTLQGFDGEDEQTPTFLFFGSVDALTAKGCSIITEES